MREVRQAFTLGYAKGYDSYIADAPPDEPPMKLGAASREDYDGGWVWGSRIGAREFLASGQFALQFPGRDPAEFAVYELQLPTGWSTDVSGVPHPSDGVRRLLHDARIVRRWDA